MAFLHHHSHAIAVLVHALYGFVVHAYALVAGALVHHRRALLPAHHLTAHAVHHLHAFAHGLHVFLHELLARLRVRSRLDLLHLLLHLFHLFLHLVHLHVIRLVVGHALGAGSVVGRVILL